MARSRKVRWGRVREISHVKRIGDGAYKGLKNRLKHLAAWRRMHMQPKTHMSVRMYGTRHKVRPSSNLRLTGKSSKLNYIKRKGL